MSEGLKREAAYWQERAENSYCAARFCRQAGNFKFAIAFQERAADEYAYARSLLFAVMGADPDDPCPPSPPSKPSTTPTSASNADAGG